MYHGYAYVGNCLLSATVKYEETGWYNGQIWIKTTEVFARDHLLGLATSLVICFLAFNIESGQRNAYNPSKEAGGKAITRVYNDEFAKSFEPTFYGERALLDS
uniref:Uncharacterized protein n=1 Tax=Nelumbo nucifera TaxID=4432 RepID=A0A822YCP0_NELNU|nr:TPA_asm: hypothetical protein HUJ06_010745 [Nelumbo nucifera]